MVAPSFTKDRSGNLTGEEETGGVAEPLNAGLVKFPYFVYAGAGVGLLDASRTYVSLLQSSETVQRLHASASSSQDPLQFMSLKLAIETSSWRGYVRSLTILIPGARRFLDTRERTDLR